MKSSFGETCCLLLIIQPWLLGRMTDASGTAWGMSVPPLSNQGLAQTLHLFVVPRAEAVVWSSFCCCSSCVSEVVIWGDLLLVVDNTALVARPYDWREWDRGSPTITDGRTNFRKKRLFINDMDARNHLPSPSFGGSCLAPQRYPICPIS